MEEKMIKLPASELEIMQAIWVLDEEGEKFISASLIMKRFPALNRLKLTTVLTLITRLQTKGFIKTEKLGRSNCYTPKISSADYRKFAYGDFVEKVYRNDRMDLFSALVNDDAISAPGDIAPVRYSFALATDIAQFGTSPSAPASASPTNGVVSLSR